MSAWIDFKDLRKRLSFESVLRHYGVTVARKRDQHHGACPLPNHGAENASESFSANLARGVFQCFVCKGKGNILDFAVLMEREPIGDGKALRRVAKKLLALLPTEKSAAGNVEEGSTDETARKGGLPVAVNARLDFELKGLDQGHEFFNRAGLGKCTVTAFGLGFCERGLLKDRIAIPIHDEKRALVGYSGLLVDESQASSENPRFRFPGKREHNGRLHEFRKSLLLYNAHRTMPPCAELVVAEGFETVWWLREHDLPNVVSVMGTDCSAEQAKLILSLLAPNGRLWVLSNEGEYGRRFAMSVLVQLSPHRFTRWARLPAETKPHQIAGAELKKLLA